MRFDFLAHRCRTCWVHQGEIFVDKTAWRSRPALLVLPMGLFPDNGAPHIASRRGLGIVDHSLGSHGR